jgi:hypothetical protein
MDNLSQAVNAVIMAREQRKRTENLRQWCKSLDELPAGATLTLKDGLIADLELQPHRWLTAGLDLLQSQRVSGFVRSMDGRQGLPLQGFLPYPVFQMGAEIFLKGMWLCQFPACRRVAHKSYAGKSARARYGKSLRGLGHDLLKNVAELRKVRQYRADPTSLLFLNRVEAIIREFYFPLYVADQRGSEWANSRYPKRFYDDSTKVGHADALKSYPQQWLVVALFEPVDQHMEKIWQLRPRLLQKRKNRKSGLPASGPAHL